VLSKTEEGSPQGGNLSPLLANIYLNEFDQEFKNEECHASDMQTISSAGEKRTGIQRLLESSTKYLEDDAETKGESGEKQNGQCVCYPKF
jgi:RNA-directed DNA polymerase